MSLIILFSLAVLFNQAENSVDLHKINIITTLQLDLKTPAKFIPVTLSGVFLRITKQPTAAYALKGPRNFPVNITVGSESSSHSVFL